MTKRTLIIATTFILLHVALLAPFVPLANLFPAAMGALSMSSMALTLVLAARWRGVDRLMGGPDKSYAAHRWLGIFAVLGALGHWATASSIGHGIVPVLGESGEDLGNVALYGLLFMTAAAMLRAIPYHLWKASHMLMGPIFVVAAYHTFFTASPVAMGTVPWLFLAISTLVGLVAWGQTLLRKITPTRLVTVDEVTQFEGGVDVTLRATSPLPKFRAGQFATLAYNEARAEAHPFTIAGGDAMSRRFVIRAGGDWTGQFTRTVRAGDQLRLGRGVGRFLPQTATARREQVWVAGGVGITPFMAALEAMVPDEGAPVTLIWCIRSRASAGGIVDVERHAARLPQLRLAIVSDEHGDQLTPSMMHNILRSTARDATLWLCGPEGLKEMVIQCWEKAGKSGRVHSERFDFRGAYGVREIIGFAKAMPGLGRLSLPARIKSWGRVWPS